jgi:hypothetical protein
VICHKNLLYHDKTLQRCLRDCRYCAPWLIANKVKWGELMGLPCGQQQTPAWGIAFARWL